MIKMLILNKIFAGFSAEAGHSIAHDRSRVFIEEKTVSN